MAENLLHRADTTAESSDGGVVCQRIVGGNVSMVRILSMTFLPGVRHGLLAACLLLLPGAAAAQADTGAYEVALARYAAKDYPGAVDALRAMLKREPGYLPALVLLGKAYLEAGHPAAAVQALEQARQRGADKGLVVGALARAYMALDKPQRVLDEFPAEGYNDALMSEVLVLRGDAHLELGEFEEAKKQYTDAKYHDLLTAAPFLGLARLAMRQGAPHAAEVQITKALTLDSRNADGWLLRGEVQRFLGRTDEAVTSYERAVSLAPDRAALRVRHAALLIDLGRIDEAREDIAQVLERNPEHPQAIYLDALVLVKEGKLDEAAGRLSTTAEAVPGGSTNSNPAALLLSGVVANARGQTGIARKSLEDFLKLEPEHALARRLLGSVLLRAGDPQLALDVLTPALQRLPRDPILHATIAVAYRETRRYPEALAAFDRAVSLSPEPAALRLERARTRLRAGQHPQAMAELEELLTVQGPMAVQVGLLLADARHRSGDTPGALQAVDSVLASAPQLTHAHLLRGDLLLVLRDPAAAAESYRRALDISPDSDAALRGLAGALLVSGDTGGAATHYRLLLEAEPGSVAAMVGLARVALAQGRSEEAIEWLEKARATDDRDLAPWVALVSLHLSTGDPDRAMALARQLDERETQSPVAAQLLAQTMVAKGELADARATYRRAAELPEAPAALLARIAAAQLSLEDADGASGTLRRAMRLAPRDLATQRLMVAADTKLERFDAALTRARSLAKQYPDRALGPALEGDVLMAMKRPGEAVLAYEQAHSREPSGSAAVRLASAVWQRSGPGAAAENLETSLGAYPNDPAVRRALATTLLAAGEYTRAQELSEQLIATSPKDVDLLNNLAWLYQTQGDPRALETATRAFEAAPERPSVLDTYGWILTESGQPAEALRILRKAEVRTPKNNWVRLHIALALSRLDRAAEARAMLQEILHDPMPAEEAVEEARALLAKLPGG